MDNVYYIYTPRALIKKRRNRCMKDVVLNEIKKDLNWRERIVIHIFTRTFIKVYNITRIKLVNSILK